MILTVDQAKEYLRVTHAQDDILIGDLILQAEQMAEEFTGRNFTGLAPSSSSETITESMKTGVMLFVQMLYEGDITRHESYRKAAEAALMPLRCNLGV